MDATHYYYYYYWLYERSIVAIATMMIYYTITGAAAIRLINFTAVRMSLATSAIIVVVRTIAIATAAVVVEPASVTIVAHGWRF